VCIFLPVKVVRPKPERSGDARAHLVSIRMVGYRYRMVKMSVVGGDEGCGKNLSGACGCVKQGQSPGFMLIPRWGDFKIIRILCQFAVYEQGLDSSQ
jgi:hypothetical protein